MRALSPAARRFLAAAAINEIQEGPTSQATAGATALAQLLTGTPAEEASHALLTNLTNAQRNAEEITRSLDEPAPILDPT